MTTQQITEQDFQHNRTFCVVHASISRDGFHVKVANRAVRITQERGGQYHLSAYGAIENIRLGQFQPRAASSYSLSGTLIGYSEDEVRLLVAAKEYLEQQRQTFIESLKQHIRDFEAASLEALAV